MEFIDIYFSPEQVSNPVTFSPSPRKPALVVADWIEKNLPIRIIDPVPVTREQIRVLEIHRNTMVACMAENVTSANQ
ncbi:MAG: hypothetical protein DID92_2727744773 [Candidatus Nitrotoga sp. SPKER]|nr:MAG: hypothetical protein DID92_2727744773 [Candidatus Nitrotoga sp. SPKER]